MGRGKQAVARLRDSRCPCSRAILRLASQRPFGIMSATKTDSQKDRHSFSDASAALWCRSGPRTGPCRQRAAFVAFWTYPRPSYYISSSVMDLAREHVGSWIFRTTLVGRPVKNGDSHLKHTATEKTAAVPVAEAESTKVLPRRRLAAP